MANIKAAGPRAIRSQMQKVRCHLCYQKHSKKRHQSAPKCGTAAALLHSVKCSSSHLMSSHLISSDLISPSQPSPAPVECHWTATPEPGSLQTPSNTLPVPPVLGKCSMSSCRVPGAELLLSHHWSFPFVCALPELHCRALVIPKPSSGEWLRWTLKVKRCQDAKEADASTQEPPQ